MCRRINEYLLLGVLELRRGRRIYSLSLDVFQDFSGRGRRHVLLSDVF
jgi:hypothetical protein